MSLLYLTIAFVGCENSNDLYPIGQGFVNTDTRIIFIDTLELETSLVILDSVPTSGTGKMLVGQVSDPDLGEIYTSSFFQFGTSSVFNPEEGITYRFDSLVMHTYYSGYYHGDTSKMQTFQVFPLSEDYELDDYGLLYNVSELEHKDAPLATHSFFPHPYNSRRLNIPLPDAWGEEIFTLMQDRADEVSSSDNFIKYFPGVCIKPLLEGAVIGFKADSSCIIRLYYSEIQGEAVAKTFDFPLVDSTKQFNHIQSNRDNTSLNSLISQNTTLSTSETADIAYVQGGVGIMTRITFPDLEQLYDLGAGAILQADLVFEPIKNSYNTGEYSLPGTLVLYETDRNNQVGNILTYDDGAIIKPVVSVDYNYHEETWYRFSITNYLNHELTNDAFSEQAVLLSLPEEKMRSTVEHLKIGSFFNRTHSMRLEVYYATSE